MTASFCSIHCASLLAAAHSLRNADVHCDIVSAFVDRMSFVIRCDNVDVVRFTPRDRIDVVLGENSRLIPAVATLFGGMTQARTASISVSYDRTYTSSIVAMFEDDRHRYVHRNGLHVAMAICDDVGVGRSDIVLYERGNIAIAFRSANTPGSIVVASYVAPGFESNPDVYRRAVDVRIAIERAMGSELARHADFRRLALDRCPSFVDAEIVETLVFHDLGPTIYALLPKSNIADVVAGENIQLVPPVVAVVIDGDEASWAYAAGLGANLPNDDIAIALMPRDAERWRTLDGEPILTATTIRRTAVDGMQCIIAEASFLPFVELRNGRTFGLGVAPLQGVGACALADKNACVLVAPSLDDVRRASPEDIERAVALALAKSPVDIGAALHGYATSIDVDRIVGAFRNAIDVD
jgi:hypothetical protein